MVLTRRRQYIGEARPNKNILSRRHHSEAIQMSLLYVCGMKKLTIGHHFSRTYGPVRKRIETLYYLLGIDNLGRYGGRHELAMHFIKQGYLETMYVLVKLINVGRDEEAVTLVREINFRERPKHE